VTPSDAPAPGHRGEQDWERSEEVWMARTRVVWVDRERWTGCGLCVDSCARGAIVVRGGCAEVHVPTCSGCEACIEICPEEAAQPVLESELVLARDDLVPARDHTDSIVQRVRLLTETVAPALAVVGAGLLARVTRAAVHAFGRWLVGTPRSHQMDQPGLDGDRSLIDPRGWGRRTRRRRRGR
jgi:ferredoxin